MINPSAWMVGNNLCRRLEQAEMHHEFSGDPIVPLYPAKTLTDEDIEPLILKMPYEPSENELYEFAYDVLRKAQEK
jgi:hypothetical protein